MASVLTPPTAVRTVADLIERRGKIPPARGTQRYLSKALADEDVNIRIEAAWALGQLGSAAEAAILTRSTP